MAPLYPAVVASDDVLRQTAGRSRVPIWVPYPLPSGWLITGLRWAGSERTGPVATVLGCSGPHPLPTSIWDGAGAVRAADLLLVAEEPGVGLGAHFAGLPTVDPAGAIGQGAPAVKLRAGGHDVPLWWIGTDDAAVFVGEAAGVWLWVLAWPADAAAVLMEKFRLEDYREPEHDLVLGFGALSPRV